MLQKYEAENNLFVDMHVRIVRTRSPNQSWKLKIGNISKACNFFAKLEQENVYYFSWKDSFNKL